MGELLNSEKTVLNVNKFTYLKVVFIDKDDNYLEEDEIVCSDECLEGILNLLAACLKNSTLPISGDYLDFIYDRLYIKKRFFEIKENDDLYIVFELLSL